MGAIMDTPWFRDPLKRRLSVVAAALLMGVFSVWPKQYMARADLMPDDSGGSLSSVLGSASGGGGLLSLGALLGNHQSIEADLTIARSQAVIKDVLKDLDPAMRKGLGTESRAEVKLRHKVDLESIRGSILQITVKDRKPDVAMALTASYVTAIRGRMTALNLEQTAQKKAIAVNRMKQATIDLATAQEALSRFRETNKLAVPEEQLGSSIALMTGLQAKMEAEQVELQTLRKFATGNNIEVQAAEADIASLQGQIAAAQTKARVGDAPTIGTMTPTITQYENLYRDERYAQAAYEIYRRYLDTVTVDEISATTNLDVIDPPFINPARQYNVSAVGALVLVLLLGVIAEFYAVRPPPGRQG
jgi:capsule polysaccharide export protein KpsE/RkpR